MSTSATGGMSSYLNEFVESSLKEAVSKAFDDAIAQAVKDAESRRDEVVASTALKISSMMSYQDLGTSIRIEIIKPEVR